MMAGAKVSAGRAIETVKIRLAEGSASLVALLVPLALIGLALRLLLTPLFLELEYRMPYFPPDEYGFTTRDRLRWGPYGLNYLVRDVEISYLQELKFDDGRPLFSPRELSHMQDVRQVTQAGLRAWYLVLVLLLGLGLWARQGGRLADYRRGLHRGGWLTIGLAGAVGLIVLLGMTTSEEIFWRFFTAFHGMFFEGDSWLFAYSDTLIRLYPIRFWQDAFLATALIVLGGGSGLAFGLKPQRSNV